MAASSMATRFVRLHLARRLLAPPAVAQRTRHHLWFRFPLLRHCASSSSSPTSLCESAPRLPRAPPTASAGGGVGDTCASGDDDDEEAAANNAGAQSKGYDGSTVAAPKPTLRAVPAPPKGRPGAPRPGGGGGQIHHRHASGASKRRPPPSAPPGPPRKGRGGGGGVIHSVPYSSTSDCSSSSSSASSSSS